MNDKNQWRLSQLEHKLKIYTKLVRADLYVVLKPQQTQRQFNG